MPRSQEGASRNSAPSARANGASRKFASPGNSKMAPIREAMALAPPSASALGTHSSICACVKKLRRSARTIAAICAPASMGSIARWANARFHPCFRARSG